MSAVSKSGNKIQGMPRLPAGASPKVNKKRIGLRNGILIPGQSNLTLN